MRPNDWPTQIADFLWGDKDEAALLNAAAAPDEKTANGQRCEAWYFAGVARSIAGQKEEAAGRFRNCLATKQEDHVEYQLAQAELRKLGP